MNITNDRNHTNLKKVHQVLMDLVDAGCIKISVVTPPKQPNLLVPIDLIPTTQTLNINYYPDKDDTSYFLGTKFDEIIEKEEN